MILRHPHHIFCCNLGNWRKRFERGERDEEKDKSAMKKIKQLPTLREKSLLDENLADFSFCDIMSVSEQEKKASLFQCERRMAIMIAA